ncbi:MAG: hypothetical protein PHZ26_03345 [Candidatus Gracilibacteria bacterium]|nr:hypothetical protein [Candidatus Gracilibacteria bacterium]MDD2908762.1 hypothetical protein [Candidatus Gracilibacteria bacterium]
MKNNIHSYRNKVITSYLPEILDEITKIFSIKIEKYIISDSLVVFVKDSFFLIKAIIGSPYEYIYMVEKMKEIGINGSDIIEMIEIEINNCKISLMKILYISGTNDVYLLKKTEFKNIYNEFILFSKKSLYLLKNTNTDGFGKISLEGNIISYEYNNELDFIEGQINKIISKNYFTIKEIDNLISEALNQKFNSLGCYVHNDITNNILYQKNDGKFYVIDPNLNVSSSSKYWDSASFFLHTESYGLINWTKELFEEFEISNFDNFYLLAKIIAYNRIQFYEKFGKNMVRKLNLSLKKLDSLKAYC